MPLGRSEQQQASGFREARANNPGRPKGKGSRSRTTRAPCTPKLGGGTHLQHNRQKQRGVPGRTPAGHPLVHPMVHHLRSGLWTCDDLRFDQRSGVSLARIPDRFMQESFGLHVFGRSEPPELRAGLIVNRLPQRIASSSRGSNHQDGELVDGRFREVTAMPEDLGKDRIALCLRRCDLLDSRRGTVLFQVEHFGMVARTQQKRGNGGTDETGHRMQQRLRSRSRATPSRSQMFVSMLRPNDVIARAHHFSDTNPILTAD